MLRITEIANSPTGAGLRVEGRIVGDGSTLLEHECAIRLDAGVPLLLDLGGVRYVDTPSIRVLRALQRRGLEFSNCSPLLADILHDAEGL